MISRGSVLICRLPGSVINSLLLWFTYLETDWGINVSYFGIDRDPFRVLFLFLLELRLFLAREYCYYCAWDDVRRGSLFPPSLALPLSVIPVNLTERRVIQHFQLCSLLHALCFLVG